MAWLLRKAGVPVTVYEAAAQEGGLGGTFRRDGFAFDYGPHEFVTDRPQLLALLEEACGTDLVRVRKNVAQHFRQRYVRYPFEVVDVVRNIGPWLTGRAMLEVAAARVRNLVRRPTDHSFRAWTCARFGRTLYEIYFGPYTEKVWGHDPDLLDPRTASERITVDSVWDLLRKTFRYQVLKADDFARAHSEFRHGFLYVKRGVGTLQAHLRRCAEQLGARFEFGKTLTGLVRDGARVTEAHFRDGTRVRGFDYLVSTVPLPRLVELALPAAAGDLLARHPLPFRSMAFVFLRIARPRLHDYHWIYFPDQDVPFQRLTEFSHFGADMCPPGTTGVALELSCVAGDALWSSSDQELGAQCVRSLERLGLVRAAEVLGCDVQRVSHAYPLQVIGFMERSRALLDALAEVGNVVSIGRQGLFRYCNMNECVEMALDVVPEITAGRSAIRYLRPGSWQGIGRTDRYEARERAGSA